MFIGREKELNKLKEFQKRETAGLIVCRGRRRIGKSTLIQEFSKKSKFINIYGLPPRDNLSNESQLKHFGELLALSFKLPEFHFLNWNEALSTLAHLVSKEKGKKVVLLDEISWMASKDKDFPGKLKGIWDTKFKSINNLVLVLCGSVTSWIDTNILEDKGFVGRVSLTLTVGELPLRDANKFWKNKKTSSDEKLKILSITGGIPRYLEEIQPDHDAESNIKRMCFSPEGFLFTEFESIFKDIFEKKDVEFRCLIDALKDGPLEYKELCKKLSLTPTGALSHKIDTLEESGFIKKDYTFNNMGKKSRIFRIRICDNYIRYYLKYIFPRREQISNHLLEDLHLDDLKGWSSIVGLQFENLVINNLKVILKILQIPPSSILSASPHFQRQTKNKDQCQIDLLIQTHKNIYPCEIKFKQEIDATVCDEMEIKLKKMKFTSSRSVRPVLIYHGELRRPDKIKETFTHTIRFKDLLLEPNS